VNELALIAIGMMFGMVLLFVGIAAAFLFYTAVQMRKESAESKKSVTASLKSNTAAIDLLRSEVALSLSRMDAERLYEASVSIQKANKRLEQTAQMLSKIVFASTSPPPGLDMTGTPGFTMEEEAADDARMLDERNRWLAEQDHDPVDPAQVQDFFERRRRETRSGIHSIGSTPPANGAYTSVTQGQPEKPVATLPDLGGDEDLVGVSELAK
jgi:hypothetical protein